MGKRLVSLDDFDRMEIDEKNQLYWDGKPVITKEKIVLDGWLNFAAVGAAVGTIASAVVDILTYVNS